MIPVIYLDELLITVGTNFLFDALLLWATSEVTKTATSRRRIVSAALLGSVHFALYYLAAYGVVGYYGILRFPLTVGFVSLLMLHITFYPWRSVRQLLRLLGIFYGIFAISAGAGLAVGNLFAYGGKPQALISNLTAIGTLLIVAELGWGIIQQRVWRSLYHVPIEIHFAERRIQAVALIDTGNALHDPITRTPVVVVEYAALRPLFPAALQTEIEQMAQGDFHNIASVLMHQHEWSSRLRLIPYSSLGNQNGLLLGFKPDKMTVNIPKIAHEAQHVIIGISHHILDRTGSYQALLHPVLLDSKETNAEASAEAAPIHSKEGGKSLVDTSP